MKYFEWLQDVPRADATTSWRIDFAVRWIGGRHLYDGKPFTSWDERLVGVFPIKPMPVDFAVALNNWPVFSPRMQEFLNENVPGVIQFLPFRLERDDGEEQMKGYAIGQILNIVDCLDRRTVIANEDWWTRRTGPAEVRHPVWINRKLIADHVVFRVLGTPVHLVIRQDLKEAIESTGLTGCRFDQEMPVSDE